MNRRAGSALPIAVLLLGLAAAGPAAQERRSVALVIPKPSAERVDDYLRIANYFSRENAPKMDGYFRAWAKDPGWGSGFATLDSTGRKLIVTNRHVVGQADSAKVILTDASGGDLAFDDCPVLYKADSVDLALILLVGHGADSVPAIAIAEAPPPDGAEVFSAGYPGLGDRPAWQLGRGIVSNARLEVKIFDWSVPTMLIQHTAQVDPGNSGGPLLVGDKGAPGGFYAAGINCLKDLKRQDANYALSSEYIRAALEKVSGGEADPVEEVSDKASRLVAQLNSGSWERAIASCIVSDELMIKEGDEIFLDLLKDMIDKARGPSYKGNDFREPDVWYREFMTWSPEETMREAISFRLFEALRSDAQDARLGNVEKVAAPDGRTYVRTTIFAASGGTLGDLLARRSVSEYRFYWKEEAGSWRIASAQVPRAGIYWTSDVTAKLDRAASKKKK
jgi:S1-C subfamily serine protease